MQVVLMDRQMVRAGPRGAIKLVDIGAAFIGKDPAFVTSSVDINEMFLAMCL